MTPQHPHEKCHECTQFFKCTELPPCTRSRPAPSAPEITFDSIANEVRLTDAGYVKCDDGGECEECGEDSSELYTHLSYENGEADKYVCPHCAFKILKDSRLECLQLSLEQKEQREATIRNQTLDALDKKLQGCIEEHGIEEFMPDIRRGEILGLLDARMQIESLRSEVQQ